MSQNKKKKISLSGVIGVLLCVIFIPVIVINLTLIISSYINPDEIPGVFGIKPAVVLSGSMEPTIQVGDLIFIHDADTEGLKEGDVICYLSSGQAVTHRITEVTTGEDGRSQYITQGDANNDKDQTAVTTDQIQGIWKGQRVAGIGNFLLFMQSTTGMLIFIVCPVLLFFIWDIWQRRRADKADAARTAELEAELEALKSGKKDETLKDMDS